MAKFFVIDENGKKVAFDHAIDAREAVATGRYFEIGKKPKTENKKPDLVIEDLEVDELIEDEIEAKIEEQE